MEVIGHRGDPARAPENTLAAMASAIQAQVQMVEFDVQLTRDGQAVVVHDEGLGRTVRGGGLVGDLTFEELQRLDAGGWYSSEFAGERVPSLAQVLELLAPSGISANLELKTNVIPYPGLVAQVVKELEQAGMSDRVIISSFNHKTLKEVQALSPGLACAALVDIQLVAPWEYLLQHGFQALHILHSACTAEDVEACQERDLAVRVWTVDDEVGARRFFEMGVDGLVTNNPEKMSRWVTHWQGVEKG